MAADSTPALGSIEYLRTIARQTVPQNVGSLATARNVLKEWQATESFATAIIAAHTFKERRTAARKGQADDYEIRLRSTHAILDSGITSFWKYQGPCVRIYHRENPSSAIHSYHLEIPIHADNTVNMEDLPSDAWRACMWASSGQVEYAFNAGAGYEIDRPSDLLMVTREAAADLAGLLVIRQQMSAAP